MIFIYMCVCFLNYVFAVCHHCIDLFVILWTAVNITDIAPVDGNRFGDPSWQWLV